MAALAKARDARRLLPKDMVNFPERFETGVRAVQLERCEQDFALFGNLLEAV